MRSLCLLLTAAALALTACGGDEETKRTKKPADKPAAGRTEEKPKATGGASSAKRYRAKANAICRQSREVVQDLREPQRPEDFADYFEQAYEKAKPFDRRFGALKPPPELAAKHKQAERESRRANRYLESLIRKLRRSDDPLTTFKGELPELGRLVDRSNRLARQMRLPDCVEEIAAGGGGESAPS